jgi:hypothetical protein
LRNVTIYLSILLCLCAVCGKTQIVDSLTLSIEKLPANYYSKVDKKLNTVNEQLTKKSLKYLAKFQRQEQKLTERLKKLNPDMVVSDATEQYAELSQKIKNKAAGINKIVSGEYNPYLDSMGTSLSFLKQVNGISDKVKQPLASFSQLQSKLQETEKIKAFIAARKAKLKDMLSKYSKLPGSIKNQYAKLNKTAYYYATQVKEYKDMLKDPDKMEQKAMSIIRQMPAFQKFWQKNSMIAQLFPIPEGYGTVRGLKGLQTNAQVQQIAFQQMGSGQSTAGNFSQYVQQQLNNAQLSLNSLKDKVAKLRGTSATGNMDIPDFQPDSQKTKTFWRRLDYGMNIQNASKTYFIPATSDIGISIGYRFSDKITAGVGSSYKLGLGSGIQHIHLTNQGLSLRSYFDIKAKGSFWLSAGWEYNYYQSFSKLTDLKNIDVWQKSALIGVKKKYKVGKKDGSIQLLYDLLAAEETPRAQLLKFRIGYSF